MKWFYNLKIAVKLIISFLIVAALAGAVGVVGLININTINNADTLLYEENTLGLDYAGNASILFQRIRYNALKMTYSTDISQRDDCINQIKDYNVKTDGYLKLYEDGIISEVDRKLFDTLKPLWVEYKAINEKSIELAQAGQAEQIGNTTMADAVRVATSLQTAIDALLEYNSTGAKTRSDTNTKLTETAIMTMVIVIFVAMVVAIMLGLFLSRMISNPVKKMVEVANKLAVGDININVKADTKDEIGNLAESFNRMIESTREQALATERMAEGDLTVEIKIRSEKDLLGKKLSEMVESNNEILTNIASASEQVAAGSKQISDSSMALSQGATEQASSIEELTASIEEITSQTKLNAENARQANQLAENAKANAVQGNTQMKEMLKAMEEINESSAKISKIIKVIDDIAFQTNMLALNAAVEAARAGQHGKGFAVVAEEVKNLAARSANAAKETTEMIEGSIKKAEGGTRIAKDTAEALNKIVNEIEKVSSLVNDIAIASNEQATGVGQINQGIMQVSQVVQTNSATSEESAAASEELSSQAELLKEMASKFKLKQYTKVNSKFNEISPEVLKMLEDMNEKKKAEMNSIKATRSEAAATNGKVKISLSEKEFGKY
jgi:methyl-accepting chemotaxis protein